MTGVNPTGGPPPTLPREPDSSRFVSPTFIRRKVLRAELAEIKASRELRGFPEQAIEEVENALGEIESRPPDVPQARPPDTPQEPVRTRFFPWMPPIRKRVAAGEQSEKCAEWDRAWNDTSIRPPQCGLVGLALSGGGVRSATVCLGVLQGLAEKKVLRLVDYLSTVSGGGYIGSSWSGLLASSPNHRKLVQSPDFPFIHEATPNGQVVEVSRHKQNKEPVALVHVRDFANYLMPRGLRDQIRVPALLLRGLIINFLLIVPAILILSAITLWVYGDAIRSGDPEKLPGLVGTFWLALVCVAYLLLATSLQTARSWSGPRRLIDVTLGWRESNGWRVRRNLLGLGSFLLLTLIVVAAFEATQYPMVWLARSEQAAGRIARGQSAGAQDAVTAERAIKARYVATTAPDGEPPAGLSTLFRSKEFWSTLGAIAGVLSALVAGQAASSSSALTRRIAFAVVGILAPIGLLVIYLWSAFWLSIFALYDYGVLYQVLGITLTDHRLWVLVYVAAALALWMLLTAIVDINRTSLHNYYRDCLSRAFIFRLEPVWDKNAPPDANPAYWRTRHQDEVQLSALRPSSTGGPYHLINAIVNSPDFSEEDRAGTETQRGRRADFFIFGPRFCGNERLGYCQTDNLENTDPDMNLATAMAISAAAAAPNMGQKTLNPLLVFLMSMLNIRLGYWMRKPDSVENVDRFRWPVGPLYFIGELIGLPLRSSSYINLSDGGHLENLGVFELLRRQCRYIIAIDAEADPEMRFNGLAILQRLARTDLGVDIHFDVEDLRKDENGLSRRHFALCKIHYADGKQGELLYVKSSITGTEIEYIKEYQRRHPEFPHETTGDQFFDEAQFEAYRALGHQIGKELVGNPYAVTTRSGAVDTADQFSTPDQLFKQVRQWLRPAAPFREDFLNLARFRRQINEVLHQPGFRDYLREIHEDLVVESSRSTIQTDAYQPGPREEQRSFDGPTYNWEAHEQEIRMVRLVDEQMQMMEHALFALHLDQRANQEHPRNRGLMNLFRSWSQAPTFHQYWALQISSYSDSLQSFGKYALGLDWQIDWTKAKRCTEAEDKIVKMYDNCEYKHQIVDECRKFFPEESEFDVIIKTRHAIVRATPPSIDETPTGLATVVALAVVVELVAIEGDEQEYLLVAFRIRDTYRSLRLSEPLLERLADVLRPDSKRNPIYYYLGGLDADGENTRRLERVLARLGDKYKKHEPIE